MKKDDLISYLYDINSELFGFSFSLVPDRLQAQQIVLDAIYAMVLEDDDLDVKMASVSSAKGEKILKGALRRSLYGNIYKIAKRRFHQLAEVLTHEEEHQPFYGLDFDQKAMLYLKHVLNFDLHEIEDILHVTQIEVMACLNCARKNFLKNLGVDFALK